MIQIIIFAVNILAVPAISLSVLMKRSGREVSFSAYWLIQYLVYLVLNVLGSHLAAYAVQKILHKSVSHYSFKYMVVAAAVAVCLPYVMEIIQKVLPRLEIEKRQR